MINRERFKHVACLFRKNKNSLPVEMGKLFFSEEFQLINGDLGGNHPCALRSFPVCSGQGTTPPIFPLGPRHSFLQPLALLVPNSSQLSLPLDTALHGRKLPSPRFRPSLGAACMQCLADTGLQRPGLGLSLPHL